MDFARQVKDSVDIVSVVGRYVRLKKAASSRWTGLCPMGSKRRFAILCWRLHVKIGGSQRVGHCLKQGMHWDADKREEACNKIVS